MKHRNIKRLSLSILGVTLGLGGANEAFSQTDTSFSLEEIVVSGRKREESLVDVPVSISVFNADAIAEQGINSLQELYDATPGMQYDVAFSDRNSSQPGVRGVQSNEVATTQQKVNTFVDGLPMIGQVGSLGFFGADQVEIYRGPQSAAFGRSTFAGAINYVSADASEEFEGDISVRTSSFGDNQVALAVSGPLTDNLGFRLSYVDETFDGPDEWVATDGTQLGAEDTETLTAKLNFQFSDSAYGELMFTSLDQNDAPGPDYFLFADDCSGDSGVFFGGMGASMELFEGAWDCDLQSNYPRRNFDLYGDFVEQYYPVNYGGLSLEAFLDQTDAAGVTYEQILLGYTVIPNVNTERDRWQGELNFEIGDSLLTFLGMKSTEFYQRWRSHSNDTTAVFRDNGTLEANAGGAATRADPTDIDESYLEARWASPEDRRLRYTLSGSYYAYDFRTDVFFNFGAIEYDLTNETTGEPIDPQDNFIISKNTENLGASFGVQYDLTDRTTLSFEGRYQSDEVCGEDAVLDFTACETTKSFAPRVAVNTTLSEDLSVYAQFSQGTNPAGINIGYANPEIAAALEIANGSVPVPSLAPDGTSVPGNAGVSYDDSTLATPSGASYSADTWLAHDEETLTNYEIGAKGSFADGRGSFAAALYYMYWEDMLQVLNLDWGDDSSVAAGDAYDGWNYEGYWDAYDGYRTTLNSGSGKFYGIEGVASYALNDVWTIGGNLTLSSNKFDDFCTTTGLNYTTDTGRLFEDEILTPDTADVLADCVKADGKNTPKTSKVKGAFDISATLPSNILGMETTLRTDIRYTGSNYVDNFNLWKIPAVTTANFSVNMRNENMNVRLYVNNLTDEELPLAIGTTSTYVENANPALSATRGNGWSITPRRPREVGLTVGYKF